MSTAIPWDPMPESCSGNYPEDGCQGKFPLKTTPGLCERCHLLDLFRNVPEEHEHISAYFQCKYCGAVNQDITATGCCPGCTAEFQKCVGYFPEDSCQGNFPLKQSYGLCIRCQILKGSEDKPNEHALVSSYPQCRKCSTIGEAMHDGICSHCEDICSIAPKDDKFLWQVLADARECRSQAWVTRMYGRAAQRQGIIL